jgi:hypothetical protein
MDFWCGFVCGFAAFPAAVLVAFAGLMVWVLFVDPIRFPSCSSMYDDFRGI